MAIVLFVSVVVLVLGISFYFGRKSQSASGYFAAGGKIHWSVNGIAFAGDYLSAASFLGIAGMIATAGYDGFLYSIGYLAGWIVALFVVAEPLKRLGKYTFADALDAKFNSRGIRLAAAISTLVVSIFYLIPQMVGAGVLVVPLLGLPYAAGVIMVGLVVITIVVTAGMTSTTYVQFIKGGLLIVFSTITVIVLFGRGLTTTPDQGGREPFNHIATLAVVQENPSLRIADPSYNIVGQHEVSGGLVFSLLEKNGEESWWKQTANPKSGAIELKETQSTVVKADGVIYINGAPESKTNQLKQVGNLETIRGIQGEEADISRVGPISFLAVIGDKDSSVNLWKRASFTDGGDEVTLYYPIIVEGNRLMRPGLKFKVEGTITDKLNFASLMLALFFGTAALPHILIRYYTVPSQAAVGTLSCMTTV